MASEPAFTRIANALAREIRDGVYRPGARLPTEAELCREYGVSRATVRQAVSALRFAGLVEPRQGSGTVVLADGSPAAPVADGGIGQFLDALQARLAIEPTVLALTAMAVTRRDLAELQELLAGMELVAGSPELAGRGDLGLHRAIIGLCPNGVIRTMAEHALDAYISSSAWYRQRLRAWNDADVTSAWVQHHARLIDALRDKDPALARRVAETHLLSALQKIATDTSLSHTTRRHINDMCSGNARGPGKQVEATKA